MRKIVSTDIFKFAKLIKAMNLKEQLKGLFVKAEKSEDIPRLAREQGVTFLGMIIEDLSNPEVEPLIYEMVADLGEVTIEELRAMELKPFLALIGDIWKEIKTTMTFEEIKSFFR